MDGQTIVLEEGKRLSILTASGEIDVQTETGQVAVSQVDLEALVEAKLAQIETPEWQLRNRMISAKKTRGATLSTDDKNFLSTYEAAMSSVLAEWDSITAAVAIGKLPDPLPDLLKNALAY